MTVYVPAADIGGMINSLTHTVYGWMLAGIVFIGVVSFFYGVFLLFRSLMSSREKKYGIAVALMILGGALGAGGAAGILKNVAKTSNDTLGNAVKENGGGNANSPLSTGIVGFGVDDLYNLLR